MLIAVTVLVILILIAIPLHRETIDSTKVTVDGANLAILNKVTQELKIRLHGNKELDLDIFSMHDDCSEALDYLVQEGYLQSVPKPSNPGMCFIWNRKEQKWEIRDVDDQDSSAVKPTKE